MVYKGKTPSVIFNGDNKPKMLEEKSFFWSRIISPIARKKGHSVVRVCNTEGELETIIVARSHGLKGGYRIAKKAKWGNLWWVPKRIPNKYRKEQPKGIRIL